MKMKVFSVGPKQFGVLIASAFLLTSCVSAGEGASPLDGLQLLTDDLSRGDLFEEVVRAAHSDDKSAQQDSLKLFSLHGAFRFPNDVTHDPIADRPRTNAIFGIDLSHHNGDDFPLELLAQKQVKFAYLKASQGASLMDGRFASFMKRLDALPDGAKVHRGAYHFLSSLSDAGNQARTFLRVVEANGGIKATDMPPVLDLEWDKKSKNSADRWAEKTADEILMAAKTWLELVEAATGRKPMLYTTRTWWRERIGDEARFTEFDGYPIWIADYSKSARGLETPNVPNGSPWLLWQFTEQAMMASGFTGKFDANIFRGSEQEFYAKLGVEAFDPPP